MKGQDLSSRTAPIRRWKTCCSVIWGWSMRDPRERLIRRFITKIYSVHKSCFFFRNISCLDFLALYTTGVPDASVIPTDTRNLFDSERWQTRAHRYGLCPHSGQMTLQNLLHFFVNIVSDGTEFAFTAVLVNMVSDGTEFAFTCEAGFVCLSLHECVDTLMSKGTCRNFEEIPLTWLLTIRKSLSSVRQV